MASDDEIIELPYDTAAMLDVAAYFLREALENPRDNRKIRASQAGHCPRKIAHDILGSPSQPTTAHQNFVFFSGHALGDAMTFKLIKMGWVDARPFINEDGELDWEGDSEEEVEDERFKGHYDIFTRPLKRVTKTGPDGRQYKTYVVTTKEDGGKRYLLDFKTMSDRVRPNWEKDAAGNPIIERKKTKNGYDYLVNKGWYGVDGGVIWPGSFTKLKGIPKDYWEQIHIYARAKEADGVMLFVMGKDVDPNITYANPDFLLNFPVKVLTSDEIDQATLDALDQKADYIYSYTEKGELPPIPDGYEKIVAEKGKRAFPCGYCGHNHSCFPDTFSPNPGLDAVRPIALEGLKIKEEKSRAKKEAEPKNPSKV